ncbi:MAG: hypothetical protein PHF84_12915, partial [bacterium]|nr:hypothetical protein [bacterium]
MMKKKLVSVCSSIVFLLVWTCVLYSAETPMRKTFSHGLSVDKDHIYLNNSRFLVKGISYSPYYPGERNHDNMKKADFRKDLTGIAQAHANTIILYWIRPEKVYLSCRELNLKIIQGITLDETEDFQNPRFKKRIMVRIKYLVDFIHKNGFSDLILAYFIGGEIDPLNIKASNFKYKTMQNYKGKHYSGKRKLNSAENFLLEMADYLRDYEESTYGKSHIVSHINWPYGEDVLNIDFMDIALFDVYSYWPPRVANFPTPGSVTGTVYQGYIENLKARYTNTPVVISEFGYSTAPEDDLASVSEETQACELVNRWVDILTARHVLAGASVFEWNDEWWKQGKGAEMVSREQDPMSHDKDDYEEWFGIISIDGSSSR